MIDRQSTMEQVASRSHAWIQEDATWWINNAGILVGERSSFIVDTCATDVRTRAFLDAVEGLTSSELRWAVNTHAHGDHTYGNSLLPSTTVLVGHENMRTTLANDPLIDGCPPLWAPVPQWGDVTRRVPDVGVIGSLRIDLGDHEVRIEHPGYPAHTTGDLIAFSETDRVLFAGDLVFHGLTPLVFMGSVDGARRSLEWLASFDADVIVPGHGAVVHTGQIASVLGEHDEYYALIQRLAAEGLRKGLRPLEVARTADLGRFADWADAERLAPNLHRAYADATGDEVDVIQALTDAVMWLGHPMHTTVNS